MKASENEFGYVYFLSSLPSLITLLETNTGHPRTRETLDRAQSDVEITIELRLAQKNAQEVDERESARRDLEDALRQLKESREVLVRINVSLLG